MIIILIIVLFILYDAEGKNVKIFHKDKWAHTYIRKSLERLFGARFVKPPGDELREHRRGNKYDVCEHI